MFASPETKIAKKDQSVHSSTGYWVTRLARAMECDFENRLSIHGVTRTACAILSAIANDNKSTPASLASFIGVDPAAMTRHLDRVEKQGLLVRERSTTDRRVVNLKLTRKGSRLVPKLVADSKATNAKFLAGLTSAETRGLQEIIHRMLANNEVAPKDL